MSVPSRAEVRVKICGICRPEDAGLAAVAGADYIGVILAPGYARTRSTTEAAAIFRAAPGVARVGVFVDAELGQMIEAASRLELDVLQLHGDEAPELAAVVRGAGGWEVWKAVRPRDGEEFIDGVAAYAGVVDAILLDGWSGAGAGGTGTRFPWDAVAAERDRLPAGARLVVAGGLDPDNVGTAVARLRPDIVDVSSSVEESIGVKASDRVRRFIAMARGASRSGVGR